MTPEIQTLARMLREKTRRAYTLAEELRRLAAALDDAAVNLDTPQEGDTGDDTDEGEGSGNLAAELARRARAAA